jgi:hypothetical protein
MMNVATRPSVSHWIIAAMVALTIATVSFVLIALLIAEILPFERRLLGLCVGTVPLFLILLQLVLRSGRAAYWSVDLGGLNSPLIGRISFDEVVSLHAGYPKAESVPMTVFQSIIAPGSRATLDETLILRLSDGRLLPLNLLSPSIVGGRAVMSKLEELLSGKRHSSIMFSKPEIVALKGRPINRIVIPRYT